jgi:hypothetical protein
MGCKEASSPFLLEFSCFYFFHRDWVGVQCTACVAYARVQDRKECVAWKSEMSKILRTRGRIDEESRLERNIEHQIVNEKEKA